MSTKTTFKRVALVAVAALGFGMLSSVPSQAADETPTSITVGTIPTAQVGVVNTTPVTVAFPAGGTTDSFTVNVRVTAAPAGSVYRSLNTNLVAGATATGNTVTGSINITLPSSNAGTLGTVTADADSVTVGALYVQSAAAALAGSAVFNISFTPM